MFDYKYLSKQHLKGFNRYKYSAIDTSPLSNYVMHPTWNTIVKIIPRFIAPNLITFAGFLCMVVVVGTMYVYDYSLYAAGGKPGAEAVPDWIYTACGVLVFLAYNLDGIDGKQARRLGVSGPLGELFDHGLDSYIVFLIPFGILSIFGRDPVYSLPCFRGFLIVLSVVLNFYASHFEKYNTGTLYLPWGYDLSMWVSSGLFILAGVYGPQYFKVRLLGDMTFAQTFEIIAHSLGVFTTLPMVVYNIHLSYKNRTGQMHSFFEAIRPLWSLVTVTVTTVYWVQFSPNDIIEYDPRSFIFMYGTVFSNIALCPLWSLVTVTVTTVYWAQFSPNDIIEYDPRSFIFMYGTVFSNIALCPLWSLVTVTVTTVYWAQFSPNDIIEYDPRSFIFMYGTVFSNIASRLIISEMSHQRCELINWFLWPLLAGVVLSLNLPALEIPVMYLLMIAALTSHVHYGVCCVRQICDHLKISCFTVPQTKRK